MIFSEEYNQKIQETRERAFQQEKWERRLKQITQQQHELSNQIVEFEVVLQDEEEDVRKLNDWSWANLFHTILRTKDEQLELERQEALHAALKLQEAKQALASLEGEREEAAQRLGELHLAREEYHAALREKEQWLLRTFTQEGARLKQIDEELVELHILIKEVDEALDAGRSLRSALESAMTSLEKAGSWGTWDLLGGGTITTAIKRSHMGDAQDHIARANSLLRRFEKELQDLNRTAQIHIENESLLTFADYFFDGLIADWIVQKRISGSLEKVKEQLRGLDDTIYMLGQKAKGLADEQRKLQSERSSIIG
jgi:DNA repair exonuclease SbcCD ATPase subunit